MTKTPLVNQKLPNKTAVRLSTQIANRDQRRRIRKVRNGGFGVAGIEVGVSGGHLAYCGLGSYRIDLSLLRYLAVGH